VRSALTALVLLCLVAGSAAAARKPSPAENTAIRSAIAGFIAQPNSPSAKNNKVVSIRVSSLDRRYAAARLSSPTVGFSVLVLHESMGTWFVEEFGSSLNCEAGPKAVLADIGVGCTPPGATAWIWNCGPLVAQPKSLTLACADANYELASLAWHGWGKASATATGVARANDCTPNCAAGHFHSYRVRVTATTLRACGRARYYARLVIAYAGARPQGIAKRDVHTLGC
jgi:hypothetical protein